MKTYEQLTEESHAMLGRRIVRGILPGLDTKCLIIWAQNRLREGHRSKHLKLLADPSAVKKEHRDQVFRACLEELSIAIDLGEIELVHAFMKQLANAVYKKRIMPGFSLQIMQQIIAKYDWR